MGCNLISFSVLKISLQNYFGQNKGVWNERLYELFFSWFAWEKSDKPFWQDLDKSVLLVRLVADTKLHAELVDQYIDKVHMYDSCHLGLGGRGGHNLRRGTWVVFGRTPTKERKIISILLSTVMLCTVMSCPVLIEIIYFVSENYKILMADKPLSTPN